MATEEVAVRVLAPHGEPFTAHEVAAWVGGDFPITGPRGEARAEGTIRSVRLLPDRRTAIVTLVVPKGMAAGIELA